MPRSANEALRQFPEIDPEIAQIRKFEVEGAQYLLVHLRQAHFSITLLEGAGKVLIPLVARAQREAGQVLEQLSEEFGVRELFVEGLSRNEMAEDQWRLSFADRYEHDPALGKTALYEHMLADIDRNLATLLDLPLPLSGELRARCTRLESERSQIVSGFHDNPDVFARGAAQYIDIIRMEHGATFDLWRSGRVTLLSAEDDLIQQKIASLKLRQPFLAGDLFKTKMDQLHDQREDHLLHLSHMRGATTSVVLFGASHSLWDNVQRWNNSHADARFSLVEVTMRTANDILHLPRKP